MHVSYIYNFHGNLQRLFPWVLRDVSMVAETISTGTYRGISRGTHRGI